MGTISRNPVKKNRQLRVHGTPMYCIVQKPKRFNWILNHGVGIPLVTLKASLKEMVKNSCS